MTILNYDHEIEKKYHPENFEGEGEMLKQSCICGKEICKDCQVEIEMLKQKGMGFSTCSSMLSSVEGIELCCICGKKIK